MAYHYCRMARDLVSDVWPHADALKEIREKAGRLSVESAAGRVGTTRSTWHAWEAGRQRPGYEKLRAIVEEFGVPPELIGYEPPQGWELVPADWIAERFRQSDERVLEALQPLHDALGTGVTLVGR